MGKHKSNQLKETHLLFSYLTGLLTSFTLLILFMMFLIIQIGFSPLMELVFPPKIITLPHDILGELTQFQAVFSNANNPTNIPRHNTILVQPDEQLHFALRSNVELIVFQLKTNQRLNFDPPIVHMRLQDYKMASPKLQSYLMDHSLLTYTYSTDDNAQRTTIPPVKSDKQILIVGDSVGFGVGVDDEHTSSSYLQSFLGNNIQVVNASVGGYNGRQAYNMAKRQSKTCSFFGLIYIICQNDFFYADLDPIEEAGYVLNQFKTLSPRFNQNILIVYVPYMEYTMHDLFKDQFWTREEIETTHQIRNELKTLSQNHGFYFYDWTNSVHHFMQQKQSIFSRFALYSDHCHLSPEGNELLAKNMYSIIRNHWLLPQKPKRIG